jgi:hypothetical protein
VTLAEQNVAFAQRAAHRRAMPGKARVVAAGAIEAPAGDLVHRRMPFECEPQRKQARRGPHATRRYFQQ